MEIKKYILRKGPEFMLFLLFSLSVFVIFYNLGHYLDSRFYIFIPINIIIFYVKAIKWQIKDDIRDKRLMDNFIISNRERKYKFFKYEIINKVKAIEDTNAYKNIVRKSKLNNLNEIK